MSEETGEVVYFKEFLDRTLGKSVTGSPTQITPEEGWTLISNFSCITDPEIRRLIVDLVGRLAAR
jgi:hypothetical protein